MQRRQRWLIGWKRFNQLPMGERSFTARTLSVESPFISPNAFLTVHCRQCARWAQKAKQIYLCRERGAREFWRSKMKGYGNKLGRCTIYVWPEPLSRCSFLRSAFRRRKKLYYIVRSNSLPPSLLLASPALWLPRRDGNKISFMFCFSMTTRTNAGGGSKVALSAAIYLDSPVANDWGRRKSQPKAAAVTYGARSSKPASLNFINIEVGDKRGIRNGRRSLFTTLLCVDRNAVRKRQEMTLSDMKYTLPFHHVLRSETMFVQSFWNIYDKAKIVIRFQNILQRDHIQIRLLLS